MNHPVRVWDLPTRVFHGLLVLCIPASLATGYLGGSWIEWHARLGYALLALLLFRLAWGFFGGRWSRFGSFLYAPRSVAAYWRGRAHPDHLVGHNPLGALSVFAMLLVLLAQVGSGLFSSDGITFSAPLNLLVSDEAGSAATWYHKKVGKWLVIGLVVLHVAAVLYYLLRRKEDLVTPMWRGDKHLPRPVPGSRDDAWSRLAALGVLAAAAAAVAWMVQQAAS